LRAPVGGPGRILAVIRELFGAAAVGSRSLRELHELRTLPSTNPRKKCG